MEVYILYSESANKYYTGHTQDIESRLTEHNKGKTTSIKYGIPWFLVFSHTCENRSEAMKLEKKIKSRGAIRFLENNEYNKIGK
jgi:putative endonuclease